MHKHRTSDEVSFGQLVGSYRTLRTKLSQRVLAGFVGISEVTLRNWETDQSKPEAKNLQKLLEVFLEHGIFTARKEQEEARAFWNASKVNVVFDEVWTGALAYVRKRKLEEQGRIDAAPTQSSEMSDFQREENFSPSNVESRDIMGEGGNEVKKDRRNLTITLTGMSIMIPGIGHQDLIADVQRVLRQPSSGPGDKELKLLEQKIVMYWQVRNDAILAPVDLILHVDEYVQDVKALLDRSLLPAIRTRLCACLSQGMLLRGVCFYDAGQFQAARACYQTAIEAAYEANNHNLQAEAWYWDSYSWLYSDGTYRYKHALDSMLKACHSASLGSDLAVQAATLAGSAEVYALHNERDACLEALKNASRLDRYGHGDWYHIHQFDPTYLNGYRGICLQQFSQSDLLEEARQALEEALSQPNVVSLQRAFFMGDMAQLYAREGEVEFACEQVRQIITIAGTSASLRYRVLAVCNLLGPYADVVAVKDLDKEVKALVLSENQ